jgi:hypothetical protein
VKRIIVLLIVALVFAALMGLNGLGAGTAFAVNQNLDQQDPPFGHSTGGTIHGSHVLLTERHGHSGKIIATETCKRTDHTITCPAP